jgi:S-methylmethionine-dependent homocysteine/selenocysteine methylase
MCRDNLPQLGGQLFLTDGGIETTLIFHEDLDLPDFAAFHLLKTVSGEATLRKYFRTYVQLARRFGAGFILESPTWRANPDWGARLGYGFADLAQANLKAIRLLEEVRAEAADAGVPMVISGNVGPRGDGYVADNAMTAAQAEDYHSRQIDTFANSAADMVCAATMNYVDEAIGVVRAARRAGMPVAILFTVETDGALPTSQTLRSAIEQTDAETDGYTSYFGINCAHPTHFEHVLTGDGNWLRRIRALRANASVKSHAELNESTTLDAGDPSELGDQYSRLRSPLAELAVVGGCCGTDDRHVEQIARACSRHAGRHG